MAPYVEYTIHTSTTEQREIILAQLTEIGFEGFEEREDRLLAYIHSANELLIQKDLQILLTNTHYTSKTLAPRNWNKEWEDSIEPLLIDDFLCIRTAFHPPQQSALHELIITPKMSFGTGHHETTASLIRLMRHIDFLHQSVLDFGAGTGILGILACVLGAKEVLAIDNDPICIENMIENKKTNSCAQMSIRLSDKLPKERFDIVLCNIHSHFILAHLSELVSLVSPQGNLLLSGFYKADAQKIIDKLHLYLPPSKVLVQNIETNSWVALCIKKRKL